MTFIIFGAAVMLLVATSRATDVNEAMEQCRSNSDKSPVSGVLNMCFYCDRSCRMKASQYNGDIDAYFARVVAVMSKLFMDSKLCVAVKLQHLQKTFAWVDISAYTNGKSGGSGLAEANNQFWKYQNFPNWISRGGCDIGFLLVDDPSAFANFGAGGVANMFQMCTAQATGVSETFADPDKMAARIAHEVGHMFGMYHDGGGVSASITSLAKYDSRFKPEVDSIVKECSDSGNCESSAECVMVPALGAAVIDHFSKCSLAYENLFAKLSQLYSRWYSMSCVSTSEDVSGASYAADAKKRQAEGDQSEASADVQNVFKELKTDTEEQPAPANGEAAKRDSETAAEESEASSDVENVFKELNTDTEEQPAPSSADEAKQKLRRFLNRRRRGV